MDAAHEADLARILENRRIRGVSAGYQSSRHYGRLPENSGQEPEEITEPSPNVLSNSFVTSVPERTDEGLVFTNNIFPKKEVAPQQISRFSDTIPTTTGFSHNISPRITARPDPKLLGPTDAVLPFPSHSLTTGFGVHRQQDVKSIQRMGDREASRNINKNFGELMLALNRSISKSATTTYGVSPNVTNEIKFATPVASLRSTEKYISVADPPSSYPTAVTHRGSDSQIAQARFSAPNQSRAGTLPPPFIFPKGAPAAAVPSSATHLDIRSAMALMKMGDWFIKWDGLHVQAAARYVWYDYTRCCLYWGPEKFKRSPLGGYVAIEEVSSVSTDQMIEFDGEIDRLFFLLIIQTPRRNLRLATEKRAKLDSWYEALTIISLYNRMYRGVSANKAISSD